MKKKLLLITISLVVVFIGTQLYSYSKNDGNLLIYICNDSKLEIVDIDLHLDGIEQVSSSFTNEIFHGYTKHPLKISPGKHKLEVKVASLGLEEEYEFNLYFIKSITVEFVEDINSNGNIEEYEFIISSHNGSLKWID